MRLDGGATIIEHAGDLCLEYRYGTHLARTRPGQEDSLSCPWQAGVGLTAQTCGSCPLTRRRMGSNKLPGGFNAFGATNHSSQSCTIMHFTSPPQSQTRTSDTTPLDSRHLRHGSKSCQLSSTDALYTLH